jgi:transcriptional regulator with XRE-family HTH domain
LKKKLAKAKRVGENLRRLMKFHGMGQVDLAKKIGKTPQQVWHWVSGGRDPQEKNAIKLAEVFELDHYLDLYKLSPGMTEPDLEYIWNSLIDLKKAYPDHVKLLRSITELMIEDHQGPSSHTLAVIKDLIEALRTKNPSPPKK